MFKEYDFLPKKRTQRVFALAVITVLILFGTHNGIFSVAAFAICVPIVIFDKSEFKLILMTYLMLLAHVFCVTPEGVSYYTFLMFLYIGVKLIEEKSVQWIVVFFAFFVVSVELFRSDFHFNETMKLIGNVLFIGCAMREIMGFSDEEKERLCVAFIWAVLISSVMRFFDNEYFRISAFTNPLLTITYNSGNDIIRFSGLYDDPNYYTVNLITALCLIVILNYRDRTSKLFCVFSAAALMYFGTLTYSKSFLLLLLFPVFMFMYANNRTGRNDIQIISFAMIAGAAAVVLLINPDYLTGMQQRLEDGNTLTTGRAEVWVEYLDYVYNHPDVMLFGKGVGAETFKALAAHNSYVDILYHLGVVGGFLLIVCIISGGIQMRIKRTNLLNYSVMISVLVAYFFLSQLHGYEFPVHFMLAFMLMTQWNLEKNADVSAQIVCTPLLPDIANGKVKTL